MSTEKAEALLASLNEFYLSKDVESREARCAALCMGDVEGFLHVMRADGKTRHPFLYTEEHCRFRFADDFRIEAPAFLEKTP